MIMLCDNLRERNNRFSSSQWPQNNNMCSVNNIRFINLLTSEIEHIEIVTIGNCNIQ